MLGFQSQAGCGGGPVEGVIDRDDPAPCTREQGCGNGSPVAACAVHPDLACRHLVHAGEEVVEWDVDGAGEVPLSPLAVPSHIQNGHPAVVLHLRQVSEARLLQPRQR